MVTALDHLIVSLHHLTIILVGIFLIPLGIALLLRHRPLPRIFRPPRPLPAGLVRCDRTGAEGILFGTDDRRRMVCSPSGAEGHIFCIGGSGTGKTSAILIPTLQHFRGTFFTVDIAGDIAANVTRPDLLILDPMDPGSMPYDIFAAADRCADPQERQEQLMKLSYLLIPEDPGASSAAMYFASEGRKILQAALIAFYDDGMDFVEICQQVVGSGYQDLFRSIDARRNRVASALIAGFRGASETNTGGCLQKAASACSFFALNRHMEHFLHRPRRGERCFEPGLLERRSVLVQIPETMVEVYAPLLRILSAQSLTAFASRPLDNQHPILMALDEFASLGNLANFSGALQKLRKRHVRILVLTQSLVDLDLVYGADTRTAMMNNFRFKIVLSATDPESQQAIAALIGHTSAPAISTTSSGLFGTHSVTTRQDRVWAVEPEELGRLKSDLILLHPEGHERLRKAPYYETDSNQNR